MNKNLKLFLISLVFSLRVYATDCVTLVGNLNAAKKMSDYAETFDRGFSPYTQKLGKEFEVIFKNGETERSMGDYGEFIFKKITLSNPINWLDIGGGLGLAPLEMVKRSGLVRATIVNAQDAWSHLYDPQFTKNYFPTLYRAAKALDVFTRDVVRPHEHTFGAWVDPSWDTILVPRIKKAYSAIESRFKYKVIMAHDFLGNSLEEFDLITDVFGAYFYSPQRLELLDEYYSHLLAGGNIFIVLHALDKHVHGDPKTWRSYGVVNKIVGSNKTLEDILVEKFPDIFSIYTQSDYHGTVTVLRMKKAGDIKHLDLKKQFRVERSFYDNSDTGSIMTQVPQLVIKSP